MKGQLYIDNKNIFTELGVATMQGNYGELVAFSHPLKPRTATIGRKRMEKSSTFRKCILTRKTSRLNSASFRSGGIMTS